MRWKLCGENHPKAKITDDQVAAIRRLARDGMSYSKIGAQFGINKGHVGKLVRLEQRADMNGVTVSLLIRHAKGYDLK